jgi:hypothetical protein
LFPVFIVFDEAGAEYHLPAVIVMRSRVRNEYERWCDTEHIHPQPSDGAYARDHGTSSSYEVE